MRVDPDIVKILREEEQLGILTTRSQRSYEELEMPEEVCEDMPDKSITVFEDDVERKTREDNTNDERGEKVLLDAAEKYRLIAERTNDLIALTTFKLNAIFTYVNPSYKKILGYEPKDLIGKPCFDFIHPDDKKNLLPLLKKYVSAKAKRLLTRKDLESSSVIEYRIKDKSGNWHYLESTANLMGDELLFISKEVTDRKKAEKEIKQAREELDQIFNTSADGMRVIDKDFNILRINETLSTLIGINKDEAIGKKCYEVFSGPLCHTPDCPLTRILEGDKHVEFDTEKERNDVTKIPCILTGTPFKGIDGELLGIVEDFKDITERKQGEREIKYLKEYNENILESNPNPIIVIKGNQIEYVNKSFISTFGKTKNDYISKELKEVMPSELIPAFDELLQDYDKIKELEIKGKSFSVSSFVVKKAEEEEEERIGIILQGITEKKKAQAKVEYQANILQNVNDAIISVDSDFNITSWNKTAEIMYGWKEKEVLGKNSFEVTKLEYSSDNIEKSLDEQIKKFYDVGSWKGNVIQHHKNGKTLQVSVSVTFIRDDQGNPVGNVTINRDVTERKKTGEEITKLSKFPSENQNPVLRVTTDNTIIYANRASKTLLDEWGCEVGSLLPEDLHSVTDDAVGSGSTKDMEVACGDVTYLLTFTTVKDENYVNIYGLDITERKKAEEKIRKQNIRLKRLDRIKTDFLNATSHELRTPMAAIKGYIQMLLKQTLGDVTPEQKDALNVVLRNTDRLDHLVQDILDISRLESGTMKFIPEKTDISKMIKESLQTMQYNAEMKNIKINTELGKNIPALTIDQERIKQVITNLVDNAIKFSPYDSTIMVRAKKDKTNVLFEVQDRGRGIPKNKQKKIFERFYQVDSGMDRKFGGAGLGLAISQGIVKSHGGNIWIDNSTKDKGSTFKFNLPIDSVENIEEKFKQMDIFDLENNK